MTINNQSRAAAIKFFYYVFIFLYLATTILLLYLEVKPIYPILGGITVFVASCIALSLSMDFNYLIYQESEKKIILRYYPLHPFHDNFKSIELAKSSLSHFDLESKYFGLRKKVILYQLTDRGLAKYPKLSLSALSKADREKLIDSLKRNARKK